jgi:hypothetical protein
VASTFRPRHPVTISGASCSRATPATTWTGSPCSRTTRTSRAWEAPDRAAASTRCWRCSPGSIRPACHDRWREPAPGLAAAARPGWRRSARHARSALSRRSRPRPVPVPDVICHPRAASARPPAAYQIVGNGTDAAPGDSANGQSDRASAGLPKGVTRFDARRARGSGGRCRADNPRRGVASARGG